MPTSRAIDKAKGSTTTPWRPASLTALLQAVAPTLGRGPKRQLADQFASFATTVQTRLDASSGIAGSFGGSIETQVERAIAQVVRSPRPASTGYSSVVNGSSSGSSSTAYMRSGYPDGTSGTWSGGYASGYTSGYTNGSTMTMASPKMAAITLASGSLPPAQQALYDEARIVADAIVPVIQSLEPIAAFVANPSDVLLFRAIIIEEITALVREFGRVDRPRTAVVRTLLGGLLGWLGTTLTDSSWKKVGDIEQLLAVLATRTGNPLVPTSAQEQQDTFATMLRVAGSALLLAWNRFAGSTSLWDATLNGRPRPALVVINGVPTPPTAAVGSLAERFIRANELLPAIGQSTAMVTNALDAIGFTFPERQTVFLDLDSLVDEDVRQGPIAFKATTQAAAPSSTTTAASATPASAAPASAADIIVTTVRPPVKMTVGDILEWSGTLSSDGQRVTEQAGQLGLNLLADQADELFWLIDAVVRPETQKLTINNTKISVNNATVVPAELLDAQVRRELVTLARDLADLADLSIAI